MARIFGSRTCSAFVRELLTAITSGDQKALFEFLGKFQEKLNGQMQLDLAAHAEAQKRAQEGVKVSPSRLTAGRV